MIERAIILERLKKKESEIQGLEEKLRAARIYMQALQDVVKLFDGPSDRPQLSDSLLKSNSAVAQARDTILALNRPVHMSELLEAQGKNTREARASLTSSLSAYVRRGEIFTRPAPNTFGLIDLGHVDSVTEPVVPPAEFGKPAIDPDDDIPF